ncbi:helix-turn-helix domain-containing protein [Lactiplantibacillus nangangensis]|uniref:Helix-turn-helix domain-containing protein n=1 Tax=Lactiplantibacillus nangangensis TaxID=2559917 RepID=A0ABW1SIY0_9LACO|nr:helix-turn-helix transcriptional regulator [Lactiplantibacillus nangangensis]
MISNKLATLMAERKIKATRLSSDTGIARSTISSLTNNDSKMIQFDTINTLCQYLNVTPADFFIYSPYDVSIDIETTKVDAYSYTNEVLEWEQKVQVYEADVFAKFTKRGQTISVVEMSAKLDSPVTHKGAEDFPLDENDEIDINIDDSSSPTFQEAWDKYFSEIELLSSLETKFRQILQEKVTAALNTASDSTDFSSWTVSTLGLPVLPF